MTRPWFDVSSGALAAILIAMAVSYLWRAGGFIVMGFIRPSERLERALAALPGSIAAAIVIPAMARSGTVAAIAIAASLFVKIWRGSDILALVVGVCAAIILRSFGL